MTVSAGHSSRASSIGRLAGFVRRGTRLTALRFLVVGGLNTLFGYAVFAGLYLAIGHRQISLVLATVAGMIFNFFTMGRLVFSNGSLRTIAPFILGYAVVLAANAAALEILARLGAPTLLAQAIALPAMAVLSFIINRHVFTRPTR